MQQAAMTAKAFGTMTAALLTQIPISAYPLVVRIMIKHDSGYCSTPLLIAGDLDCLNNWRLLESLGQIGTNPH